MGIDTSDLIFITLSMVVFFVIVGVLYRYLQGATRLEERLDTIIETKSVIQGNQHSALGRTNQNAEGINRFLNLDSTMSQLFLGMTKNASHHYQLQFDQAGLSSTRAPKIVLLIKTGTFLLGVLLCALLYFFQDVIASKNILLLIFLYATIILFALKGYDIVMHFLIKSRYERIQRTLAFSVDLLSICVRAGYSLDRSFEIIAEEVSYYNIDMCVEFMKVSIELSVIPDRKEALRNLAKRIDLPLTKILVTGLIQSEEQGASMGQTLTHLSQDFSKQKLAEIDEIATKIPVKILLPMGLFCLPGFLLFVMGPLVATVARSSIMNL